MIGESIRVTTKLRHVDIHNMFLEQEFENDSFQITYLPTGQMPTDGLTKALSRRRLEQFRALLNMVSLSRAERNSGHQQSVGLVDEDSNSTITLA